MDLGSKESNRRMLSILFLYPSLPVAWYAVWGRMCPSPVIYLGIRPIWYIGMSHKIIIKSLTDGLNASEAIYFDKINPNHDMAFLVFLKIPSLFNIWTGWWWLLVGGRGIWCDCNKFRIKAAAISGQGLEPYVTICHDTVTRPWRVQPRSAESECAGEAGDN